MTNPTIERLVQVAADAICENESDILEDGWDTSLRGDRMCFDGEMQLGPVVRAILTELREPNDAMLGAAARLNHPRDAEIWQAILDHILESK